MIIQGLVSASHLNGQRGEVVKYEKESRRYRVRLVATATKTKNNVGNDKKRNLAVKPENILLGDDPQKQHWDDRLLHLFCPCHTSDTRRHEQFRQCARSMFSPLGRCRIFVGVGGQNHEMREKAMDTLRTAATLTADGHHQQWFVVEEASSRPKSQFEHFQSLLPLSLALNPSAWIMFLDNDDMLHPVRVHWFQVLAKRFKDDPRVDGFFSGGKLLIDDNMVRTKFGEESVPALELFLEGNESLNGIVDVAASADENAEKDVTEYFDFCIRSSVLKRFLSLTPDRILIHRCCDVRFMECIVRLQIKNCPHPAQEWLLMHYRIRLRDRNQLCLNRDTTSRTNAMMAVTVSDQDRALSAETGLDVELIAFCRKDVEEGVIQMIERDDEALEHRRKMVVPSMDEDYGHKIGSRLWEETCLELSSYFPEDLAKRNRQWCAAGKTPAYNLEEDLNTDGMF